MKVCGAKTRGGGNCKNKAGHKTGHVGDGRCFLHGGATPVKHGLRSKVQSARFKELVEFHKQNPDPLNLLPEVAQLRAHAQELMERWESIYGVDGALIAWHDSFLNGDAALAPKPRHVPDFSAISAVIDKVGAMVDRIQRHRAMQSLSVEVVYNLLEVFGAETFAALKDVELDDDTIARFIDAVKPRWAAIRIGAGAGGVRRLG